MIDKTIKISIIGKSGVGKSTFSEIAKLFFLEKGLTTEIVKLSEPLYSLQKQFHEYADIKSGKSAQDQVLMENICNILRELNPLSLVNNFSGKLEDLKCDVIINDDLRDPDVDSLYFKKNGFTIIRIESDENIRLSRLNKRKDISKSDKSSERINLIPVNLVLENNGDLEAYKEKIWALLEDIYDTNRK